MNKLIKIVLQIMKFSKMVVRNLPLNIKIYLVLKAFWNPSSGLRDTKYHLSFLKDGSVLASNFNSPQQNAPNENFNHLQCGLK